MSKPLRFISLTPDQQRIVNNVYQYGEKRALRRRAHAILLSYKGHTINQIHDILGVKRDTVSVVKKYMLALIGKVSAPASLIQVGLSDGMTSQLAT